MISKKLLSSLELKIFKDFKRKYKEIFDFIIYGSVIRNKINPNDIDIAIFFHSPKNLNEKLNLSQELRNDLRKHNEHDFDIKGIDLNDLLDSSFKAGKSIISEGFLILEKKFLYETLGFKSFYIFSYSLKNLSLSKKVMFQYALNGRRGEKGILESTNSTHLGKGVVKVPLEHSEELKEFFEKNKLEYKIQRCLIY